jgi:iron-sulfur cluster repair protein YtfE (RIC family)
MMHEQRADLLRDHELIAVLASRLSLLIRDGADPAALSTALQHLVDTVEAHLAHEDATIYDLALQAQGGAGQQAIDALQSEFELLKASWGRYLCRWTPDAIAADRDGFVEASNRILPRLNDRVRLENQLLVARAMSRPSQH